MKIIDCSISEFIERESARKIFCFGAGNFFEVMCIDMGGHLNIAGIIDNNPAKWGKTVSAGGIQAKVYSLETALNEFNAGNMAILITASAHTAIITQLGDIPRLAGCDCYVYGLMKFKSIRPLETLIPTHPEPVIPPVLHYCWFGKGAMPGRYLEMMKTWEAKCPGYGIVRWDESNYDIGKNAYLKKAYEKREWAFFVDYARIDIITNNGGICLDTDIEILKNLDVLRRFSCFIGTEALGGINAGSGLGAVKGLPLMQDFLRDFDEEINSQNEHDVVLRANMGRETEFFWKHGFVPNNELQIIEDAAVLPFNIMSPKIKETGDIVMNDLTFCFHHFDGSWIKWEKL